jgi:dTMP kinase
MALFITFEGGEGSGKTAQARALYRRLSSLSIPVLLVHEPGGTQLGRRLRYLLKRPKNTDISPLSELLMFNASRAQLVDEVIRPGLEKGNVVICDRYADSTIAYQSYGRGLDLETVDIINRTATRGLKPDLTVLLDIAVEGGLARKMTKEHDRFEREDLAFHQKVREGYLKLATGEPERWLVVDGTLTKTEIVNIIWQRVSQMLSREGMLP